MKKLVGISSCEECPWVDRWECDMGNHIDIGYNPYCLFNPKRKRKITTPLNTIPNWCPLPDAEEK